MYIIPIQIRLSNPNSVAIDSTGDLVVTDEGFRDHTVWRIDPAGNGSLLAGRSRQRGGFADGPSAQESRLYYPRGIAIDGAGNTYVADGRNHRVRKIDLSGAVTTIAGTGEQGYGGDGGPALAAMLNWPSDVHVGGAGHIYVSESSNHTVRRIDSQGIIETIAGTGSPGYSGDGGPAEQAQLASPRAILVTAAGELFIAETANDRIRKVDVAGVISTFAGTGTAFARRNGGSAALAQFGYPFGIAADANGNVYVADSNQIRKIGSDGMISAVAGTGTYGFSGDGGPAIEAQLGSPGALAVDIAGNLYVGGSDDRVRRIDGAGIITTIAGTGESGFAGDGGPATAAQLNDPRAIAVDSLGNVYIADYFNHRVRRVDALGVITTFAGSGVPDRTSEYGYVLATGESESDYSPQPDGSAPAAQTRLTTPFGLGVDADNNVYVADRGNRSLPEARIGKILASSPDRVITPLDLRDVPRFSTDFAIDAEGNTYFTYSGSVLKYSTDGAVSTIAGRGETRPTGDGEPAAGVKIGQFLRIAPDELGNVWIADSSNRRVHVLEPVR